MYQSQIKNTFKFEVILGSQYGQYKLNVYKIVLQEVCEKFNGAEEYIKKRIEELCNEKKLSAEEVTYLFTNNHKFC